MPVRVGGFQAVELGQGDGLDDGEALAAPVFEIAFGFLAGEPVEEFPGGVAQVEEGRPVRVDEEAAVRGDPQVPAGEVGGGSVLREGGARRRRQEPGGRHGSLRKKYPLKSY